MRCNVLTVIVALLGYCLAEGGPSEALDSLSCSRLVQRSRGMILDIKKSVNMGAKLILGTWSDSEESCLSSCCKRATCDLALFKTQGLSKAGNNCYLVRCGSLLNCHMVPLDSFVSIFLSQSLNSGTRRGEQSHALDTSTAGRGRNGPDTHNSRVTGPSHQTDAPPTTTPPIKHSNTITKPSRSNVPLQPKDITTEPDKSHTVDDEKSPTQQDNSTKYSSSNTSVEADKQDLGSEPSASKKEKDKKNRPCGAYGCDGSGVVAVVVVAAICTSIIIVVGAILLKKVVDERRRKKFKNVDYLINGMYT